MFAQFSWHEFLSTFVVLFAIIDMAGNLPVVINLRSRGKTVKPLKASVTAFCMFILFFYGGEAFLRLFNIDISSFAVAGALVIFIIAMEMILDIEIFKSSEHTPKDATIVPVVFPMVAGSGALTTILTLRSQYADINILLAILVNIIVVFFVLRLTKRVASMLGPGMVYMLQKLFGIILLAISVKLFTTNVVILIENLTPTGL